MLGNHYGHMTPETMRKRVPLGIKVPGLAGEGALLKRSSNNRDASCKSSAGVRLYVPLGHRGGRREGWGYSRDVSLLLGFILPLSLSWEVALPVEATVQVYA